MSEPNEEKMEVYKKSCERIVEDKGACSPVFCVNCPFYKDNNGYDKDCVDLGAAKGTKDPEDEDPLLLENVQKFIDGIIIFHEGKLVEIED